MLLDNEGPGIGRTTKKKLELEIEMKDVVEDSQTKNLLWALPKSFMNITKGITDLEEKLTDMKVLPIKGSESDSDDNDIN